MIFAFLSIALVRSQMATLRRVSSAFMSISTVIEMRNFFVELERDAKLEKQGSKEEKFEKKIAYPPMSISVELKKFTDQSPLFIFPSGRAVVNQAVYELRATPQKEQLVGFIAVPLPPKVSKKDAQPGDQKPLAPPGKPSQLASPGKTPGPKKPLGMG